MFYLVLTHISRLDVVCCLVPAQFITSHRAVVLIVLLPNLILTRSTACWFLLAKRKPKNNKEMLSERKHEKYKSRQKIKDNWTWVFLNFIITPRFSRVSCPTLNANRYRINWLKLSWTWTLTTRWCFLRDS